MNFFIILIFVFLVLAFTAIKLFRPKQKLKGEETFVLDAKVESVLGLAIVDIHDVMTIELILGEDNLNDFKSKNLVNNIDVKREPRNNRYCYYGFIENENRNISLNLKLNNYSLFYNNTYALNLNATNHIFTGIEFDVQISDFKVSLEQAFNDYKKFMQKLLDLGCQNYFGLAEVRYKKEQYNKLLASGDHHCLAPDLIQFEEFKAVVQSNNFDSLDSYFYLDDFIVRIFYNFDYSVSFEIFYANGIECALSNFGNDDLYLDHLSEDRAQLKLKEFVDKYFAKRAELEANAKSEGFEIDESYQDPFINFELLKKLT